MSFKKKITLTLGIIIVIFLVTISFFIYVKSASILNNEAEQYMEVQLLRAQEKIDLLVESIQQETKLLARDKKVEIFLNNEIDMNELNSYLTDKMYALNKSRNYYKDLFIINPEGYIISTTMVEAINLDLTDRDYVLKCKDIEEPVTSDILNARSDGSMIVNTVYPIYDDNNNLIALSGIAIKAEKFVNFIKDFKLGNLGYYVIIDSNGFILSHINTDMIGNKIEHTIYENDLNKINKNIFKIDESKGLLRIYRKMNSNNWILMANLPTKELKQKSAGLLIYVLIFGCIFILAAIGTSIFISTKISKPINSITNYIDSITNSNNYMDKTIQDTKNAFYKKDEDEIKNLNNSYINLKNYLEKTNIFEKDSQKLIKTSKELTTSLEKKSYQTARFISTLSHDLRTSITLIKGFSKGLISDMVKDEDDKKRFLNEIYNSAENIEKITLDILDSTYEAQYNQKLHKEKTSIINYINKLVYESEIYVENSGRTFTSSITCKKKSYIYIDSIKIERVINNLITNAVKYSKKDSTITFIIQETENFLSFEVKDNGIGITKKNKEYIFDMFYKGDNKDKKSYGLGLFISKSIIDAHGSKLNFESKVGVGSRFWFDLKKI